MLKEKADIYAGIVSYNPDLKRLGDNIASISKQTWVVVFDNGSDNFNDIKKMVEKYESVILLNSKNNLGIAAALNRLMQWGYDRNYKWMLSLDQDSVCDKNYVVRMMPYLDIESKLGIIAPVIVDRNVGVVGHNPVESYMHVNTCITSGAISRISAWKEIGKYDESMFIDSVDFEFCYRMRKYGYGVIQVRDEKLLHELGESKKKRFFLWKIDVTGHSSFRKYYIARNNVYYPLKHHLWLHFVRGNLRNVVLICIVILYENNKGKKISSILRGWRDAFSVRGKCNGD